MKTFGPDKKLKAFTLSYDDGVTQDIRLIELLNKYNLKCTFNLNSGFLGQRGILDRWGRRISHYKIHPEDVKYVYDGHEVAVHTVNHPVLPDCSDEVVIREVEQDRISLSELVGYEVVGMAYPSRGIGSDERVPRLIRENTGVKYVRSIEDTDSFDLQEDLYKFRPNVYNLLEMDRMFEIGKRFAELTPDRPQIFYAWGHAYEMDFESNFWVKLEEFFEMMANRDDIFYGTNKEVLL
ncbi:MAG: polysaccharide deacetylase family protein [Clostridia bacterium]|nr:polysaccharide deacetylase family protein [Clostridia bacterium]